MIYKCTLRYSLSNIMLMKPQMWDARDDRKVGEAREFVLKAILGLVVRAQINTTVC